MSTDVGSDFKKKNNYIHEDNNEYSTNGTSLIKRAFEYFNKDSDALTNMTNKKPSPKSVINIKTSEHYRIAKTYDKYSLPKTHCDSNDLKGCSTVNLIKD